MLTKLDHFPKLLSVVNPVTLCIMTLDSILFSLFLALNLIVGLWYGRQVKTLTEYAIGNKSFSTGTITATIVATGISGGFLFYGLEKTYTQGLLFIIPILVGPFVSYWITARFVVVRMETFFHTLSVAEAMGNLYGGVARFITAISGILVMTGFVTMQFKAIPQILSLAFGLEGASITLITAGIIIAYSAFGGIWSVTLTDVLQFIAICVCMPFLLLATYNSCRDTSLSALATHPGFNWQALKQTMGWNPTCMQFVSLLLFWGFPAIVSYPSFFQRVAMVHSTYQAKKAFSYAAFFNLLITSFVILIGVFLIVHNPAIPPKGLVQYMLATYSAYPALRGLLAIGVVALAMSTADSCLNSAAVIFVNDLIKPFQRTEEKKDKIEHNLAIVRLCSWLIGALALVMAFKFDDLLQLLILSSTFSKPTYLPPLLLAIFGFRSTSTAVISGMVAGGMAAACWRTFFMYTGVDSILPGMVANCLVLFICHILLPKPKDKPNDKPDPSDKPPLTGTHYTRKQAKKEWLGQVKTFHFQLGLLYFNTCLLLSFFGLLE